MVPARVTIICRAYLELLVTTRTDKTVVSAIKLPFQWLDAFTFLCNKLNFIISLSHEKKFSQIFESLARKWNTLERNGLTTVATWLKQRESITHNSNFSYLKLLEVPCSSSYPSFTVFDWYEHVDKQSPISNLTKLITHWHRKQMWANQSYVTEVTRKT